MGKKHKSYRELRAFWYDRLAKTGFQDIENLDGTLKSPSADITKREKREYFRQLSRENQVETAITAREALADYYRLARQFYNDYEFKKPIHKQVWELHSEGYPNKGVAAKLVISIGKVKTIIANHKELMLGFKIK